ncbi:MAG TPA: efflux RND transporter periplasmic adaptor subunit, partial [Allocoleopsis sp.]
LQNGNAFQPVEVTLGQTSGDMVEVKTGLFEGDLVVTQRAPQLYAQSLRGGSKPSESEQKRVATPQMTERKTNSFPVPWWLVGTTGGVAIASGAFWLGRRSKPSAERLVYETSNGSSSPNGKAELSESHMGKLCELPVLVESDRNHSDNNHHH